MVYKRQAMLLLLPQVFGLCALVCTSHMLFADMLAKPKLGLERRING